MTSSTSITVAQGATSSNLVLYFLQYRSGSLRTQLVISMVTEVEETSQGNYLKPTHDLVIISSRGICDILCKLFVAVEVPHCNRWWPQKKSSSDLCKCELFENYPWHQLVKILAVISSIQHASEAHDSHVLEAIYCCSKGTVPVTVRWRGSVSTVLTFENPIFFISSSKAKVKYSSIQGSVDFIKVNIAGGKFCTQFKPL